MLLVTLAAIAASCALALAFAIRWGILQGRRAQAEREENRAMRSAESRHYSTELVQEAVLESEARLNGIIESAMDAIITVDERQKIVLFNPAAEQMFECPAEKALGGPLDQFIPERFRPAHSEHMRKFGEAKITRRQMGNLGSISGLRRGGQEFPIEASISQVRVGGRTLFTAIVRDITERKAAEADIRSRSARFRSLIENSADGITVLNAEGKIVYASAPAEKMLGYRPGEMVGDRVLDLLHPDDRERYLSVRQANFSGAPPALARFRMRHKDGSWRIIEAIRSNQLDNPDVHGVVVNSRDVTEAVQVEAALRRQAALFDQAYDAVFVWEWNGAITFWNRAAERLYGYSRDEAVGRISHELLRTKTLGSDLPFLVHLERDRNWEGELEHTTCDGRRMTVDCRMTLAHDEEHVYVLETTRDITERKRAESALRESEERLQRVTEGMTEGLVISDMEGNFFHWNPAAIEIHGFASDEDGHRQLPELQHIFELLTLDGTAIPFEQWPLPRILRGERLREYELRIRRIGSDWERVFSYGGTTVRNSLGNQIAFCTIADITERKRAQEEIQLLNRDLERRVEQRTAELQAANKELESFSYSVAHDLRAPLRAVDGFSDALLEDYGPQLPQEGKKYLHTIRGGVQRMGRLIDDLLAFSRLNRQALARQPVDMEMLVRGVLEDVVPQGKQGNVQIVNGNLPSAQGDASLLRQVWANLLSNAVKYSRYAQQARIEVGSLAEGNRNVYYVRDNGAGFDMKYADKLFGVFQRLHRADEFEGTGIGLAIVQRVVHRHGGRVWAEAKVNQGATFYFTLEGEN